ncbi:MAG: ABC transporter ATP-binding protein [Anaerolineae bacterium]|nr:ABC transporter ATP-binding protein [Anaerolineae bacterium]
MAAITVAHLTKRFVGKTAVNDVSFSLGKHEFLVLVGPSGCGKTTTLRMLAGLEPTTSGDIYFGARRVNDIRPKERNVAMVFQDYAVFPHLTVYENIAYGLRSRGAPRSLIAERVPAAAERFRIDHLLQRKPRQLSGGERQRVALSRAMVRDADLFLYDEPLSNLDAQLRHQAREDIVTLHNQKQKPSIYVTHDQSEAMAMGDRIAVMRDGRIEQIGTGGELYERPANLFVAYFIGTPSINLFDVILQAHGDGLYAATAGLRVLLPPEIRAGLQDRMGSTVKMGLRPEDFHVPKFAPFEVTEHNQTRGIVNVIEPSSTGCTVYLSTVEGTPQDFAATFRTRLPASYLGKEIPLALHLEKAHFFDAEHGASLLSR